jgi:hypothetical protein
MNKIKTTLIALFGAVALTTSALSGTFGVGVSGSLYTIEAGVTEKTTAGTVSGGTADTHTGNVENIMVPVPAVFAEYNFDSFYGMTVGYEFVLGTADVSKNFKSREEAPTSGDNVGVNTTFKANASIENLSTAYIELPIGGFFIKGGYAMADVITEESGMTAYGNADLDGLVYGVGFKSGSDAGMNYKLAYEAMDFDTISVKNANGNEVSGNIDTAGLKLSIGYNF